MLQERLDSGFVRQVRERFVQNCLHQLPKVVAWVGVVLRLQRDTSLGSAPKIKISVRPSATGSRPDFRMGRTISHAGI